MRKHQVSSEALQLDEKRRETLEVFEVAIRDWHTLGLKKQNEVENRVKFDARHLKPEQLKLVKQAFADGSILTEKAFDELMKQGYLADGVTPPTEKKEYSLDSVSQAKLNKLSEKAIPKTGFIKKYIDVYSEVTDTPIAFLFWGAMVAIATVLGKNAYIPWETRRLYPNLWCVFLAPSGSRKGTGIDIPTRLLREIDPELLLPQTASEEGLTKALAEEGAEGGGGEGHDIGFVRWQEFSKILRTWRSKQSWQASQEFWINIWDNKETKKKLSGGEFNIPVTSISFLSACTPKTFSKFFTPEDLEGGFFGRIYLISCIKKDKYFPIPPSIESSDERKKAEGELIQQLKDIKTHFTGELSYKKFEDAFCHWAKETQKDHKPGFLDSFYSRIETHVMKLAVIYEAATTKKTEITEESFTLAVNAIEFLIASAYPLISEEIGLSEGEKEISRVAKYIQEKIEVRKSEVMQNLHISATYMDGIERTLEERELITVDKTRGERGPTRKTYFWSGNNRKPLA